jgi:hypothetical protein
MCTLHSRIRWIMTFSPWITRGGRARGPKIDNGNDATQLSQQFNAAVHHIYHAPSWAAIVPALETGSIPVQKMTDNPVEVAPEIPGEQHVPEIDNAERPTEQPEDKADVNEESTEENVAVEETEVAEEVAEEPVEQSGGVKEEADDEVAGKRKHSEVSEEEPEAKKMNTGVGMDMEVWMDFIAPSSSTFHRARRCESALLFLTCKVNLDSNIYADESVTAASGSGHGRHYSG